MMWLARLISYVKPMYRFNTRSVMKVDDWRANWVNDPLFTGASISADNMVRNDQTLKHLHENVLDQVKTPFLMILGGKEQLVCNKAAKNFFDVSEVADKDLIEIDDGDHFMIQDGAYWETIANEIIGWYNTHR
jgi:esterase/lipase